MVRKWKRWGILCLLFSCLFLMTGCWAAIKAPEKEEVTLSPAQDGKKVVFREDFVSFSLPASFKGTVRYYKPAEPLNYEVGYDFRDPEEADQAYLQYQYLMLDDGGGELEEKEEETRVEALISQIIKGYEGEKEEEIQLSGKTYLPFSSHFKKGGETFYSRGYIHCEGRAVHVFNFGSFSKEGGSEEAAIRELLESVSYPPVQP